MIILPPDDIDPFLEEHQLAPLLFRLGSPLTPISIRDQMVRAQMLVERLLENRLLSTSSPAELLIVGAGVAGVVAALTAAAKGVETVLVDTAPVACGAQLDATSRWVDPAIYDWPIDHWGTGEYPPQPLAAQVPLSWAANWGNELAAEWQVSLAAFCRASTKLQFLSLTKVTHLRLDQLDVRISATLENRAGQTKTQSFAVIILATGSGQESCKLRDAGGKTNYMGTRFWGNDHLCEPGGGRELSTVERPTIVIVGAGDGGLQDFLRALTKRHQVADILRVCQLPESLRAQVQSIEDRLTRPLGWRKRPSPNPGHEHMVHQALQTEHARLVEEILADPLVTSNLGRLFPSEPREQVHLVYHCQHFTCEYPLNRFLVLLIARYLETTFGTKDLLLGGLRVSGVTANDGHACVAYNGDYIHRSTICVGRLE